MELGLDGEAVLSRPGIGNAIDVLINPTVGMLRCFLRPSQEELYILPEALARITWGWRNPTSASIR